MPLWHGKELFSDSSIDTGNNKSTRDANPSPSTSIRRSGSISGFHLKHIQIMQKLLQLIHLMADLISDWDCIVDCLEQFTTFHFNYLLKDSTISTTATANNNVNKSDKSSSQTSFFAGDIEKIMNMIDSFKHFTRYLSAETLIKLMTSLVALSMNNIAVTSTSVENLLLNSPPTGSSSVGNSSSLYANREEHFTFDITDIKRFSKAIAMTNSTTNSTTGGGISLASSSGSQQYLQPIPKTSSLLQKEPAAVKLNYLQRGMKNGCVNFSLKSVIEISKVNSFRISSIWQMVTSHLRMMSSMKVSTKLNYSHLILISFLSSNSRKLAEHCLSWQFMT
jgi:hypothetical protein